MKGFEKILKFNVFESYENARKIADDIIVSLVKNSCCETEDDKRFLPTYSSIVRENFCSSFLDCFMEEDPEEKVDEDKRIGTYSISIYEVRGNRRSRLSVTQNKELRDIVCQ